MGEEREPRGLIDTDILIDFLRGFDLADQFLNNQKHRGLLVSDITAMELIKGCHNFMEIKKVERFLESFQIIPLSPDISQKARDMMTQFAVSHGLAIPDALIAATAMVYNLNLFTKNIRHFQMIPELISIRPY